MESDSEFDYADQDQEQQSSDDDSQAAALQQASRHMQRPQSRLAGIVPAAQSAAPVQNSSLGLEYEPPLPGGYDPAEYDDLPVSQDVQDLFQYIFQYKPEVLQLETPLKPFIPEYIPAIGDIDEFIKVGRPDGKPDLLGLKVLDEPAAIQSDPSVLAMQLRHASKQAGASSSTTAQVATVQNPTKNGKRITDWIKSINDLQKTKPGSIVQLRHAMPDIESLMQQWPPAVEQHLHTMKLPDASLDVSLTTFVKIVCGVLDIPVFENPIESLHTLFTLLLEFKNNPAFKDSVGMLDQKVLSQPGPFAEQQMGLRPDSGQTVSSNGRTSANFLSLG